MNHEGLIKLAKTADNTKRKLISGGTAGLGALGAGGVAYALTGRGGVDKGLTKAVKYAKDEWQNMEKVKEEFSNMLKRTTEKGGPEKRILSLRDSLSQAIASSQKRFNDYDALKGELEKAVKKLRGKKMRNAALATLGAGALLGGGAALYDRNKNNK